MSAVVLVDISVKAQSVGAFQSLMDDTLPDTRAFDGCQAIKLLQDQDDPTSFVLYEVWDSKAHHEQYLKWREETGFLEHLGELSASAPNIRYFDITNS